MIYVISDIHGCYDEYIQLLKKIDFSNADELYVLGDIVDRGPEPVKVLFDMMLRPNVYPIIGNHEYMALKILSKLNVEIKEDNADDYLDKEDIEDFMYWIKDGGNTTVEKFQELSVEDRNVLLEYLQEFSVYEEIDVEGKRFILVHADLHGCEKRKPLEDYGLEDFLFYRAKYNQRYFEEENTVLVTGHTPTFTIREDRKALIYDANGHLAIDCGCVYGGRLAAYCLNNGKVEYVDKQQ